MTEELKYYWVDVPMNYRPISEIPSWWHNFETHCIKIFLSEEGKWHLHTVMTYELKPYGGKYKHRKTGSSIRFNDESGYTMFMLKFL